LLVHGEACDRDTVLIVFSLYGQELPGVVGYLVRYSGRDDK